MPAKIRLQRKGKKGQPFYHIVIADGRAPREGRFIERIGTYNPLTKPAEIDLNFDKAINWMQKGAQPTDTVKAILSYKGVLYKFHLLQGVKKGAMTPEQAEEKFQAWASEKQAKIVSKIRENELKAKDSKKEQVAHEVELNEAKAAAVAKKLAKVAEAEAAARKEVIAEMQAKAEVEAAAAVKMKAAADATEEGVAEAKEEVAAEAKEEVAADATEEGVSEAKEEVAAEPEAAPQEPETPAEEPKQE
ncbi:MAG TPA: 30S ribosomal protein S16 [Bacteroidales bacterium]|nr:30S ribosomal protein S16 [Bacteroidales bacterium]